MDKFLCLATCWEDDYLVQLEEQGIHDKVYELYGSLGTSIIGSGRASFSLPKISSEQARRHIQKAHSLGIKFDYLLNASCLGNREFENEGRKKILTLLDWLDECDVDMVTVSIPYLVEVIKRYFPRMAVNISTIAHVDSVSKAKFWEAMGADRITLDYMMNRDFEFLKSIGNAINCELEVIVNDLCIYACPFRYYHYNTMAHGSQEVGGEGSLKHQLATSYPVLKCSLTRLTDFSEIIKMRWIRPEDVGFYRALGIDFFKLVERTRPMNDLLSYARAYSEQTYNGNLLDIVPILPGGMEDGEFFTRSVPIYVDNEKLKGFLDCFQSSKCRTNCHECNYCHEVAEKVVRIINKEQLDELIDSLTERVNSATSWEAIIS